MGSLILANLKVALLRASEAVVSNWHLEKEVTKKGDGTLLTHVDLLVNECLRRDLRGLKATAGWLSEESVDDLSRLRCGEVWIVDPLDGTKEFIRNIPECAISVALARENQVVLGGVVNPLTGEGAVGDSSGQFECWGITLEKNPSRSLQESIVSVSRTEVEEGSVIPYLKMIGQYRAVGSVAYKLLRVACGKDDLTFSVQPKSEWDIAGGAALLMATGKAYRRFDDQPFIFNQKTPRIPSGTVAGSQKSVDQFINQLHA